MARTSPDPALVAAFVAAVVGDAPATARALRRGFRSGLPLARATEAMRMVHLFAGFPRALSALEALRAARSRRSSASSVDRARPEAGRRAFERIYGLQADPVRRLLRDLDPCVARWIRDHAYGRVLSRPGLPLRDRECLAVAALVATHQEKQLVSHVRGAERSGASVRAILACARAGARRLPRASRARLLATVERSLSSSSA